MCNEVENSFLSSAEFQRLNPLIFNGQADPFEYQGQSDKPLNVKSNKLFENLNKLFENLRMTNPSKQGSEFVNTTRDRNIDIVAIKVGNNHLSLITRKPVVRVCDQLRHNTQLMRLTMVLKFRL